MRCCDRKSEYSVNWSRDQSIKEDWKGSLCFQFRLKLNLGRFLVGHFKKSHLKIAKFCVFSRRSIMNPWRAFRALGKKLQIGSPPPSPFKLMARLFFHRIKVGVAASAVAWQKKKYKKLKKYLLFALKRKMERLHFSRSNAPQYFRRRREGKIKNKMRKNSKLKQKFCQSSALIIIASKTVCSSLSVLCSPFDRD